LCKPGDDAQTTRVRNGRSQFGKADKVHAALNDGVLNAKEFGDFGFHGAGSSFGLWVVRAGFEGSIEALAQWV
jgi:hypothetical protein